MVNFTGCRNYHVVQELTTSAAAIQFLTITARTRYTILTKLGEYTKQRSSYRKITLPEMEIIKNVIRCKCGQRRRHSNKKLAFTSVYSM